MIIKLKAFCPSVHLSAYLHFLISFISAFIKMRPPLHEVSFASRVVYMSMPMNAH